MIRRERGLLGLLVNKDMAAFGFVHAFELLISESPPILLPGLVHLPTSEPLFRHPKRQRIHWKDRRGTEDGGRSEKREAGSRNAEAGLRASGQALGDLGVRFRRVVRATEGLRPGGPIMSTLCVE